MPLPQDESDMPFNGTCRSVGSVAVAINVCLVLLLLGKQCHSQVALQCDFTKGRNRGLPMHDHWNVSNRISPIRGFAQPVGDDPKITIVRPLGGKAKNGRKLIDEDTCVWDGQKYVYNWAPLKQQIDNVLKRADVHQLMIDNPPWSFQRGANLQGQKEVETYGNAAPPGDVKAWSAYIVAMVQELVSTYGKNRVEGWRFCIGREIGTRGHWTGTALEFFQHYKITHQSIRSVLPEAKIGTHFLWASSRNSAGPQFVKWCARNDVSYDFIGVSFYPFYDRIERVDLDRVYKNDFAPIKDTRQWNPDAALEIHEFALITKLSKQGNRFENAPQGHLESFTVLMAKMFYEHGMTDIFRWGTGAEKIAEGVFRTMKGNVYYRSSKRGSPTPAGNMIDGVFALDDQNRQCNIVVGCYNANPQSRRPDPVKIETLLPFKAGTEVKWRVALCNRGSLNWGAWQSMKTTSVARSQGSKLGFDLAMAPFTFQKLEIVIPQNAKLIDENPKVAAKEKASPKRVTARSKRTSLSAKQSTAIAKKDEARTKRVITNRGTGAKVEVELVSLQDGKLTCITKGRRFVFPLTNLSREDQAFIEAWSKSN
jgi:hypothetical protein